ncbi:bifunctional diguanylate cyclase/phosphohydrolase [Cellulosilyticum sp. I15G10I2]|uniref:bifunctional diguanylate cyclase/phosphohydrolase n=1 Tax=Cellulosilyticum sp. I15G10I2 TaxID=1892843 RepID=UPI00085C9C4E|nr:diguanylate cyclase [Cellulosilyticum sp. I15G10I2]
MNQLKDNQLKDNKRNQISDIVSVVKICAFLFIAVIFFKYYYTDERLSSHTTYANYSFTSLGIVIFLLLFAYGIWKFSTSKKIDIKYDKYLQIVEDGLFILLFSLVILLTGAPDSQYKYLFLFIIITATIQEGIERGILVACISSTIILGMDLIMLADMAVNPYFEDDLILSGIFILTAWPLGYYVKIEREHIKELENMVHKDGLTGVYNHRFFCDALRQQVINSEKQQQPISMLFIDIDYFKEYNDLHGHQKGDEALRAIGNLLRASVKPGEIVARYGGEEFAVLLPHTEEEQAIQIAEAIRSKVEQTYFYGQENQPNSNLTVSLGISTYPTKARNDIELIKSADDALYRAKFFNRNRVETYSSILDDLKKEIDEKDVELITSVKTLISVINAKDRYTYAHTEKVVMYSRLLAEHLKLTEEDKKTLIYGAYMHDIGKINITKQLLNKKMPLSDEEWEILKQHPAEGVEIIKPVISLRSIMPLIYHHHERYDGKGYPLGLKGEEIPFLARVLTVVDSFDAMTSNRPYNKRKTYEEGIEELRRCSGVQFDPDITEAFIEVIKTSKDHFDNLI